MSTTIDEKVVSMQFDNKNFEKNVSETMSTLDNLKQKLNFSGVSKGFNEISKASQNVDMATLDSSVDKVGLRFNALYTIADQALRRITDSALATGISIGKALTIDPVKMGLSEYETQLNAIQTVLANTESKGTTLDDVNAALDELNLYADKTIYNFTEMTKNIGTFTAAGIDLDTSVSAIQGIANLAAVSGSTSQQASTAMYQLSQALASGTVKLMDWNSVVNAGMGGQVFQDALKETARVHGVAIDDMIKSQGSFRESLSEGWLTSEILTETLEKFTYSAEEGSAEWENYKKTLMSQGYTEAQANEILKLGNTATDAATKVKTFTQLIDTSKEALQSGWSQSFRTIIGDFEEAKELWTGVSNVIGDIINSSAESRNALLSGALDSGWSKFLDQGIMDSESYVDNLKQIAKQSGVSIDEMIENEGSLEKALRKGFKDNTITSEMMSQALDSMTVAYSEFSEEELKNAGYTSEQVEKLQELNEQFKSGKLSMDDFVESMSKMSGRELIIDSFKNIYELIVDIITPIKEAFREIFPKTTADQLYKIINAIHEFTENLELNGKTVENLKRTFRGLFALLDIVFTITKGLVKTIFNLLGCFSGLGGGVLELTGNFGDLILRFRDFIKQVDVFEKINNKITEFREKINKKFEASGLMSFSEILSKIWDKIVLVSGAIIGVFKPAMNTLGNAFKSTFKGIDFSGNILEKLQTVLALLAGGGIVIIIKKIIDVLKGAKETVGGLGDFIDALAEPFQSLSNVMKSVSVRLMAESLKTLAVSMLLLVASLVILAMMDEDKLANALAAMIITLGIMIGALVILKKTMGTGRQSLKAIRGLKSIAIALLILSFALKNLGEMSWSEIGKSLSVMAGALALMTGVVLILSSIDKKDSKSIKRVVNTFTKISISLLILSFALQKLGQMSWSEICRGLTAMAGVLVLMVGSLAIMSKIDGKSKGTRGMLKVTLSLVILGAVLKSLGSMSWDEIKRGLTAMTGILVLLVGSLAIMSKVKPSLTSTLGMLKITLSLVILGMALKSLGEMSWPEIARGLAAMCGVMVLLVGSLAIMSKVKPSLTSTLGMLKITLSLAILSASLRKLGEMSWSEIGRGLTAMTGVLAILMVAMALMSKMTSGSFGGLKLIAASAALIILSVALTNLLVPLTILGNMETGTLIKGLLGLAAAVAIFAVAGLLLKGATGALLVLSFVMLAFGAGIALVGVGIGMLLSGIAALIVSIATLCDVLIKGGETLVKTILTLVSGAIKLIPESIVAIGQGIVALLDIIIAAAPKIGEAVVAVILSILDVLVTVIPKLVDGLLKILVGILQGLTEYLPDIVGTILELIISIIEAIAQQLPRLIQIVVDVCMAFVTGVLEAFRSIDTETLVNGLAGVKFMMGMLVTLAAAALLAPAAMIGVVAAGIVFTELSIMLGILGKMFDLMPNLASNIEKTIPILGAVGTAIGTFIGNLVGSLIKGVVEQSITTLPVIADNLSSFIEKLQPFIEGVKNIDMKFIGKTALLVGAISLITAAAFINSILSFVTGGKYMQKFHDDIITFGSAILAFTSMTSTVDHDALTKATVAGLKLAEMAQAIPTTGGLWGLLRGNKNIDEFGKQLVSFGLGLRGFVTTLNGLDFSNVQSAADAGSVLAEMASTIPVTGGLWGLLRGDNNLGDFGRQIKKFGEGLRGFIESLSGADFSNVQSAVDAGTLLAEMASNVPVTGGLWGMTKGDNNLGQFGKQIKKFGKGLRAFMESLSGADFSNIDKAVDAGHKLSEMASTIPVTGGLWGLIKGDNSLGDFGRQIKKFGEGLRGFIESLSGADFSNIDIAVDAGAKLAKMASTIPVTGGLWGLLRGDNNLGDFGIQLSLFGLGLRGFIESLSGADFNNVDIAVDAGAKLAKMASIIPVTGGLWSLIKGDQNLATFGSQLTYFGRGLKGFTSSISGGDFTNVDVAVDAGIKLAEMANKIPTTGGLWNLIKGENSLLNFSIQIAAFGKGVKGFAGSLQGVDFTNAGAAADVGVKLGEMASKIPVSGGLWSLVKGESNLSNFSSQLVTFGEGLKGFIEKIKGITDLSNVDIVVDIGLKLGEMASKIPVSGGLWSVVKGEQSLSNFSTQIQEFGSGLKAFIDEVKDLTFDNANKAADAGMTLAKMASEIPVKKGLFDENKANMKSFKSQIVTFGEGIANFIDEIDDVEDFDKAESAANTGVKLAKAAKSLPEELNVSSFGKQLKTFGKGIKNFAKQVSEVDTEVLATKTKGIKTTLTNLKKVVKTGLEAVNTQIKNSSSDTGKAIKKLLDDLIDDIKDYKPKFKAAGAELAESLESGLESKEDQVKTSFKGILSAVASSASNNALTQSFFNVGKNASQGLINGLNSKLSAVIAAGRALGNAAKGGTSNALREASPSKEMRKIGVYGGEGLVLGLEDTEGAVYNASYGLGDNALSGIKKAMMSIGDSIDSDLDLQPTITPVVDLTNVKNSAGTLNNMFGLNPSVGVMSNIRSINSMMNTNQNGGNDDVVSAIRALQSSIEDNPREVINIGDVSYDGDTQISNTINQLIRLLKIEGRV